MQYGEERGFDVMGGEGPTKADMKTGEIAYGGFVYKVTSNGVRRQLSIDETKNPAEVEKQNQLARQNSGAGVKFGTGVAYGYGSPNAA